MSKIIRNTIQIIKEKKLLLIRGFILSLIINFVFILKAKAALLSIGDIVSDAIYKILGLIASFIALVASQIIILEAKILALIVNASVFTKMPVVQTGWRIARDFTNILFIIILIYIAFSYILRIQSKETKGLLVKMIIMAVLINFSLMIGGAIIDFSNMFFRYFVFGSLGGDPTGLDGVRFTNTLANALKLQTLIDSQGKFLATPTATSSLAEWEAWIQQKMASENEKNILNGLIKIVFTIIFSFLMIIIFGALVGILFVRLFWLWILLIFAPLAWVISLISIPGTPSNISKQWWSKFLQWCFVGPVMGFFIYLALETANHVQQLTIPSVISTGMKSVMYDIQQIMQMFLVAGFIVAGLIAGEIMGDKIAGLALYLANFLGDITKGFIKRKASSWALQAANIPATGLEKAASKNKIARAAISVTGLGIASRYVSRKAEEAKSKDWNERRKKYESVNVEQLKKMANSALIPAERAAMFSVLAQKGGIDDTNKDQALSLLNKYDKDSYKKVLNEHPEWHPAVQTAVKRGDIKQVKEVIKSNSDLDINKFNISKIKDEVILSAAVELKIDLDPEKAALELRNLDLGLLNKLTTAIKERFKGLDIENKKEFANKMKSGYTGRQWFNANLNADLEEALKEEERRKTENEKSKENSFKLYDEKGREIK
ncbi:MAG: hypothetical protein QXD43_03530 [Candidatus Aenigmatarchaeota archaeon]